MSLKNTKIRAEIVKSFAPYFKDSDNPFRIKWFHDANEEDRLLGAKNKISDTETTKNARTPSPRIAEKYQKFDCQQGNENTVCAVETNQLNFTESSIADEKFLPHAEEIADGTVNNWNGDFVSFDNGAPESLQKDCAGIDDIETASTASAQLSRYIKLNDQQGKKLSSAEEKEIENLIGNELISPAMTTGSINDPCAFDRAYDILPDAQNPMVFHICAKIPGTDQSFDRRMIRGCHQSSVFYSGPELKRCIVPIKDFRVKQRKQNPLADMEFFAERPEKEKVKRVRRAKSNYWCRPRRKSPVNKKKGRGSRRKIGAQTKDEDVVQRSSLWSTIQEAYAKPTEETAASEPSPPAELPAPVNPNGMQTISVEQKNVSIKEWLELSSQAHTDNNLDVNEFLQYASLPILSDIEDDAYQLSTFLDFNDQASHRGSGNAGIAKPIVQMAHQWNVRVPMNGVADATDDCPQPLDLSAKQTTPASTDTGFCNGSSSFGVASPYHFGQKRTVQTSNVDSDVRNVYVTNVDFSRCEETGVVTASSVPATAANGNPGTIFPSNTSADATEKQLCVVEPMVEVTPVVTETPPVVKPLETLIVPEVKASQRIVFPTDLNIDSYSTDLDYEPSEADDDDDNADDDKLSSATTHRTGNSAHPLDTDDVKSESCADSHKDDVIKTAILSSRSVDTTQPTSATVNVVQPQPTAAQNEIPAIVLIEVPSQPTVVQTNRPAIIVTGLKRLPDHLKQPASSDQIDLLKQQVDYLLNRLCINILFDERCDKGNCRKNHNLPPADEVLNKLQLFPTDTLLSVYARFIAINRMAFVHYFPAMCTILSIRKLKASLIGAVEHCDHHNKKSYYDDIYRGCIRMGMFKLEALTAIAHVSCKSTISCTYILNIIVKEDPELFKEMLRDFYLLANIDTHHMLSLLVHLSKSPEPTLLKLFVDIFNKYSRSDISDIVPYKMIYHEIRSLAGCHPKLVRRLNSIVSRDKRLSVE